MSATVVRGSPAFTEEDAYAVFSREGLSPTRWSNGPGDTYGAHSHAYDKVLYCLRGSITFRLVEGGDDIKLLPGDRLDLAAGTIHSAVVGPEGVSCIEAAASAQGHEAGPGH